ncbi:MAG: hypothetical protein WCP96_11620 [Methylococcaceae bacterium]
MAEQDERTVSMETFNDNYDSPWKEAVEHYFPEFIGFVRQVVAYTTVFN